MKKTTVLLSILVVISLAFLVSTISHTMLNDEAKGNHYTVKLQDSLAVSDEVEVKIPHPLIGKIVYNEDGTTCWKIEEKIGVFYYRMLGDCTNA